VNSYHPRRRVRRTAPVGAGRTPTDTTTTVSGGLETLLVPLHRDATGRWHLTEPTSPPRSG